MHTICVLEDSKRCWSCVANVEVALQRSIKDVRKSAKGLSLLPQHERPRCLDADQRPCSKLHLSRQSKKQKEISGGSCHVQVLQPQGQVCNVPYKCGTGAKFSFSIRRYLCILITGPRVHLFRDNATRKGRTIWRRNLFL